MNTSLCECGRKVKYQIKEHVFLMITKTSYVCGDCALEKSRYPSRVVDVKTLEKKHNELKWGD